MLKCGEEGPPALGEASSSVLKRGKSISRNAMERKSQGGLSSSKRTAAAGEELGGKGLGKTPNLID